MTLIINIILLAGAIFSILKAGINTLSIIYGSIALLLLVFNLNPVLNLITFKKDGLKFALMLASYAAALIISYAVFNVMPQSQEIKDDLKVHKAYGLINTDKSGEALSTLEAMKEKFAGNSVFHQNLAVIYLNTGKLDLARNELDQAYSLNPLNYSIIFNYGLLYFKNGNYNDALTDFKIAAEMNPAMTMAYIYAGDACRKLGNLRGAIYYYGIADRQVPGNRNINYLLGKVCYDLNEFSDAEKYLDIASAKDPLPEMKADIDKMLKDLDRIAGEVKDK